ncbi:PilN domain-containing protein [Pseudidiomarina gelatinasegens]|uniref:PilN domain-containing protein n=1 Tax=Pseudidiomarina gelatinasegens TaxID=2487740 RepID=UPI0030EDDCAC|tara:strand:+ start:1947 stop:2582 length:636 start_codon:yes stop_codon:yes gene_type:complete
MKHLANLYLSELQPSREKLTFNRVMGATASLLVVAVVLGISMHLWASQQQINTQRAAHALSQAQQKLAAKQQQLRAAMNNPDVEQRIEQTELQLGQRQRLLQQMQQITESGQVSFATLLNELAQADVEAIWLQRILVANSELTLQGKTANASALPVWLASFSNYPSLSGRQFGVFELRDNASSGVLDFTVGSLQHSSLLSSQPSRGAGAAQ